MEIKKLQRLNNLQHMVAIDDSKRSMAREEDEANRDSRWQEHMLYGGEKPAGDTETRNDSEMMIAGDVNVMQPTPPPEATSPPDPKQPWYQKHALPLALATGIAGYAGSQMLTPKPPTEISAPDKTIQFDPGRLIIETVDPGTLNSKP